MEGVDLGHRHIVIGAQPLGDFDHLRWHIQMKRRPLSAEIHPLGEGFEVVHRLDGLHFDDGGNFFPTVQSGQHHVGVENRSTGPDRGILLGAWIDSGIETTAKPCLEKSNDPVVLQLLADRPDGLRHQRTDVNGTTQILWDGDEPLAQVDNTGAVKKYWSRAESPLPGGKWSRLVKVRVPGNPFPDQYGPKLPGPEATFLTPVAVYGLFQRDFVLPQFGTWNLTLERQLAKDWVVRASYVGNKASHLNGDYKANREFNPAIYTPGQSTPANTQERRLYPQFSTIGEVTSVNNSHHEALQLNVEKRFSRGLTLLANYTWSKTIDDINWTDPFERKFDYGKSNDDISHIFKFSNVWQIPSGHLSGVPAKILGGWELNTIWTWRGGFPFSIYSGEDNSLTGVGKDRADQKWFDTSPFAPNAIGTFGNSGKNILRGPKFFDADFGLLKDTKLTETTSVQFRAEFFNAFNNVNFGSPDNNVTSGTFGQITTAGPPRILQFGLKFLF